MTSSVMRHLSRAAAEPAALAALISMALIWETSLEIFSEIFLEAVDAAEGQRTTVR